MKIAYEKFLIDPSKIINCLTVSHDEAIADVQLLIEALEKAYPAKWTMDQAQWNQVITNLHAINFQDNLSVDRLGETLADILWPIPDGHLKVRNKEVTCGSLYKKNLRQPTTGKNLANLDAGEFWKMEFRKTPRGMVPVLAISGFPQSSEPSWNGFTEAIAEILKAPSLIVDLRGNGGGDDTKAIELVSALLGYELDINWVREIFCESAEAYALQINTYERIIWNNYKSKNEKAPSELINHLVELKEKALNLFINFPQGKKLIVEAESSVSSEHKIPKFDSDIFILIDPQTVSSGEWASLYLKNHPKAKIVGENTYGMIHFGNTGYLQLPNSGLIISLCMKINEISDGNFYEKLGVPPDIKVSSEDSLEYVISHFVNWE
jgi:hypothetical protein